MSKIKTVSGVLLAFVLIVGMALLPRGVARISDHLTNGKQGTASMQSVELALYSNQSEESGYMIRKLALEREMTTIPIRPTQAKMTEEEVFTAALNGMKAYTEAKVFEWFDYQYSSAEPYLGIDPEDKSNNMIFWGVNFSVEDKLYHNLFLHIDDETGKILFLAYETDGPDKFNYYYPENQQVMMEEFVNSFFSPLNLTGDQLSQYENLLRSDAIVQPTTDDVTCVVYTFVDEEYGTIRVEFRILPTGLRMYFTGE